MYATTALFAAAVAVTLAPDVASAQTGRFDPPTATYRIKTGDYCIRSGWGFASLTIGRRVRAGECLSADAWRRRGLKFDSVAAVRKIPGRTIDVAAR